MKIHFLGLGGIGVSSLAQYYLARGEKVSGSDLAESEITQALKKQGARVFIGSHRASNLRERFDLVVYSPAITPDNPELKAAQKEGIPCQSYPQALGELTKKHFTLAVCGTHGKGTTTALISLILIKAKFDPTVVIGTKLKEFGDSNFRPGKSKYLVIEADEYKASFLNYWPKIIVLTTIDKDHLDYFKTLGNILKTFIQFVKHLPQDGWLVANAGEKNSREVLAQSSSQTIDYDPSKAREAARLRKILRIPGEHIVADALAALAVARILEIPDKISFQALGEYHGAWRRFEESELKMPLRGFSKKYSTDRARSPVDAKLKIISDYAHHPTEISVTLKAVREKYPGKEIWCVFQPHQYQRTYYLFSDFVKVLSQAPVDKLILAPIYSVAGRESRSIKRKVSSLKLARAIQKILDTKYQIPDTKTIYISTILKITQYLRKNIKSSSVLVVMGAGDIYRLPQLLENKTISH